MKKFIFSTGGALEASLTTNVNLKIQVGEQTLDSGRKLPALKMISSDVEIPDKGINLKLHGGIVFDSINLIKKAFMGTIRKEIVKEVNSALMDQIPKMLDAKIAESKG